MKLLCTLLAAVSGLSAADRWFEIRLAGAPTGYVHETVEARADGGYSTTEEMLFVINRMGSKVEIKSKSTTVEDRAGNFVSVESEGSSSHQTTRFTARRTSAGIDLETRSGDKSYTREIPVTGPVYGPRAAEHFGDKVTYALFQPELGGIVHITRTLRSRGDRETVFEERSDMTPGVATTTLDASGDVIAHAYDLPFGHVDVKLASRTAALAAAGGSELPEETWSRTLARSNVRLPDPRSIEKIRLKLTQRRPELGWPSFDAPWQRVIERSASTVVLEVSRPGRHPGVSSMEPAAYLKPNAVLQSDDPEVVRIARGVVANESDRFEAARKLQDWSAGHMKLDAGIAGAPASEVAHNLRGTCVAYSILLASFDRAAGIPSRIAMGYVYVDGIWGAHAWTEVLIDGQWVPLDSAVYRPGIADASRFQFASYTYDDQMAAATSDGARMYGNIDVAVLQYTIGGRTIVVPEGAADHTVDGDTYRNAWLGFSIVKPDGARFTSMDDVYPDATVVALERDDAKVTIEQAERTKPVDGRPALVVSSAKTRLAIDAGESTWILTVEGKDGDRLLDQVVAGWKWISAK